MKGFLKEAESWGSGISQGRGGEGEKKTGWFQVELAACVTVHG